MSTDEEYLIESLRDLLINAGEEEDEYGTNCSCGENEEGQLLTPCNEMERWLKTSFSFFPEEAEAVSCGRKSRVYIFGDEVKRISIMTEDEKNRVEAFYKVASEKGLGPKILKESQFIPLNDDGVPQSWKEGEGKGNLSDYGCLCQTLEVCSEAKREDTEFADKCASLFKKLSDNGFLVLDLDGNFMQNQEGEYVVTDFDEETSLVLEDLCDEERLMLGVLNACSSNERLGIQKYIKTHILDSKEKRENTIVSFKSLCQKINMKIPKDSDFHMPTLKTKLVIAFLQLNRDPTEEVTEGEAVVRANEVQNCNPPLLPTKASEEKSQGKRVPLTNLSNLK
jgi:hypothetical protein